MSTTPPWLTEAFIICYLGPCRVFITTKRICYWPPSTTTHSRTHGGVGEKQGQGDNVIRALHNSSPTPAELTPINLLLHVAVAVIAPPPSPYALILVWQMRWHMTAATFCLQAVVKEGEENKQVSRKWRRQRDDDDDVGETYCVFFHFSFIFFLTFICAGRIWHSELISCHADEAGRVWDENSFWSGESVTSRFISSSFFIYVSLSPTFFFVVAGKR